MTINIIEKGSLQIELYDLTGKKLYDETLSVDTNGVRKIALDQIHSINQSIVVLEVTLNNKYTDVKKM